MPKPTDQQTIREWIASIQDHNTRRMILMRANHETLEDAAPTLYDALAGAFSWSDSKEGFEYWANIADDLCHIESIAEARLEFDPDHFNHE